MTRRGRLVAAAVAASLVLATTTVLLTREPHIVKPDDPCMHPPPLQRFHGVTLQPLAMAAYKVANGLAGHRIEVVESYRSCSAQAKACKRLCGNPAGCPGLCARPGASYHQLGAAIDVSQAMLDSTKVRLALSVARWCQPLPRSDPGHWSFDGCH
jgi:hypothetical protein